MTVIVGVLSLPRDGVVVGSDSSATLTAIAKQKTIDNQYRNILLSGLM